MSVASRGKRQMRGRSRLPLLASLCLAGAFASPAAADTHGEAEQLFREAKDMLKAGRIAEACTAFEASQRLDPSVATLMNLADCREKNQQLATAWSLFLQVVTKTRGDATYAAMGDIALRRATTLEPRLSHLIINVPDESRLDGLVIQRNGVAIDQATWNRAIAVDGGHYVITAKAPDHEPWKTEVDVAREHDRKSVDVPRFKEVTAVALGDAPAEGAAASPGGRGRRTVALGVTAGAVVSFGLAIGFELSGRAAYGEYERTPERTELYDRANGRHHIAQACGVVGVVATGVAAYLWLSGSPARDRALTVVPVAAPGHAGVALVRGF